MVGFCRCAQDFSSCSKRGLLFIAVCRLLPVLASLIAQGLGTQASVVATHRLSCSVVCGIFWDQRWNQCPLQCKVDS